MIKYPERFKNEEELEEAISRPTDKVVDLLKNLEGEIIFLGVAGKMGVSLARMVKRACDKAGVVKKIFGVSRFSSENQRLYLEESGIETIKGDLSDQNFINRLPDVPNVFYLAGMKFGTEGNEFLTWAMNSYVPGLIVEKYKKSRIVAFSTGCVYPVVDIKTGGSIETDRPNPIGEYAQSCLGRERIFEYGSYKNKTAIILIRLFYSVEMRYGLLVDIGTQVFNEEPIDLSMGYVNVIWQGDANSMIIQALNLCESPPNILNITGSQILSVRKIAQEFGKIFKKRAIFLGRENKTALLGDAGLSHKIIEKPYVQVSQIIQWTGDWIMEKKNTLGKPTHYEVRNGRY